MILASQNWARTHRAIVIQHSISRGAAAASYVIVSPAVQLGGCAARDIAI